MNGPKQSGRDRGAVDQSGSSVGTVSRQSIVVVTMIMRQDEGTGCIASLTTKCLEGVDVETGASIHRVASLGLVHRHEYR